MAGGARVEVSKALPGLEMAMVEEALTRGKAEDDGAINRWLIEQFSSKNRFKQYRTIQN